MKLHALYYDSDNKRYIFTFRDENKETAWYITQWMLENNPVESAKLLKQVYEYGS